MLTRTILKRMNNEDRNLVRDGAMITTLITGAFSYYNYRSWLKKDFLRSEAHYRFSSRATNITPWK